MDLYLIDTYQDFKIAAKLEDDNAIWFKIPKNKYTDSRWSYILFDHNKSILSPFGDDFGNFKLYKIKDELGLIDDNVDYADILDCIKTDLSKSITGLDESGDIIFDEQKVISVISKSINFKYEVNKFNYVAATILCYDTDTEKSEINFFMYDLSNDKFIVLNDITEFYNLNFGTVIYLGSALDRISYSSTRDDMESYVKDSMLMAVKF